MSTEPSPDDSELEALRARWQAHDERLDAILRLNTRQVREQIGGRMTTRLRRLAWGLGVELAVLIPMVIGLGSFCYTHRDNLRLLATAVLLLASAVGLVVAAVRQLAVMQTLTPDAPVVLLQTRVESLRLERLRAILGALVLGPLLWVPALIVVVQWLFGVDLFAVASGAWIAANLAFGMLVIMGTTLVVRRYRVGPDRPPGVQRLMALLAGDTIADVRRFLDDLASLESTPPARP
jgi:hypothetical protein